MSYFDSTQSALELKTNYRRLASRYHPDRGGCKLRMQLINIEYRSRLNSLRDAKSHRNTRGKFIDIRVGDAILINGTESEVTEVSDEWFRVVAKGRSRQAVFDKLTGLGKYNRRLKACYQNEYAETMN